MFASSKHKDATSRNALPAGFRSTCVSQARLTACLPVGHSAPFVRGPVPRSPFFSSGICQGGFFASVQITGAKRWSCGWQSYLRPRTAGWFIRFVVEGLLPNCKSIRQIDALHLRCSLSSSLLPLLLVEALPRAEADDGNPCSQSERPGLDMLPP